MKTRLYQGNVWHKRLGPVSHGFAYAATYLLVDLDELDELDRLSPFFSREKANLMTFRRSDYLPSARDLKSEVLSQIQDQTGERPDGPVYLLTMPRALGKLMNPISLFYSYDARGALRYILAEVTNTPWGERHVYVVPSSGDRRSAKSFHVSPFMPQRQQYAWQFGDPCARLCVSITTTQNDQRIFDAGMNLTQMPVSFSTLASLAVGPIKTALAIYREAFSLWRKRAPLFVHPRIQARLVKHLESIADEEIVIEDGDLTTRDDARLHVTITDERAYREVALGGALGAGEAYMNGWWRTDDLTRLLRAFVRNRQVLMSMKRSPAARILDRIMHLANRSTPRGSKRNIRAHYDLGNSLFETFLDPTMTYSAGYFTDSGTSMENASIEKLDRICRKLHLGPDDHVLEIGTGWGSFAIHAASKYRCRVTTTTISDAQYELAARRICDAGLGDRVTLLKQDYRELGGVYDKLVSIEMIEAVGLENIPGYLRSCEKLLADDGLMAIQAITIADQHYHHARRNVDFIQKYIFPGGALPSVTSLARDATRHTNLRLMEIEDMTTHYAETLRRWRNAFMGNLETVRELGYDETFIRMWEYYLCYCEAGFEERSIGCVQAVFHSPRYRGSI